MSYKGKYSPLNPSKYAGDPTDIIYRSLWERQVFKWCDYSSSVVKWSSETIVVPYRCKTDNKIHRYFIDLYIEFSSGKKILVEIKPKSQYQPPIKGNKSDKKFLIEVLKYAKNTSKWEAAQQFAEKNGVEFQIWTEDTLTKMGLVSRNYIR